MLTDKEKFISDVTGLFYAHLDNYGNYNIDATLKNYLNFSKPNLSRKDIDEIRRDIESHMMEMSDKLAKWTNATIEEHLMK